MNTSARADLPYNSQQLEVVQLHFRVLQAEDLAPLLTQLWRVALHLELTQYRVENAEAEQ